MLALKNCCLKVSQKWVFTVLATFGLALLFGSRAILPITMIEMVTHKHLTNNQDNISSCIPSNFTLENIFPANISFENITSEYIWNSTFGNITYENSTFRNVTPENSTISPITPRNSRVFDWDEYTQGIVLSSLFWCYGPTQLICGWLPERFGGKHFHGFGILAIAILAILTPTVVNYGDSTAMIIIRVFMGIASGFVFPSTNTLISQWTAPIERTRICSIIYAGSLFGTILGTTSSALIIRYSSWGWPGVFYAFGTVGMVWFPFWALFVYSSPDEHPFISEEEFTYLKESLEGQKHKNAPPAPWRHILTSKPFFAFMFALLGSDWAFFAMTNDLPKYMSRVIGFSIESNGYISSCSYLSMWLCGMISSWISVKILQKNLLSLTNLRKILTVICLIGPSSLIVGASYVERDPTAIVAMFVLGITLMGCSYSSLMVNSLDLSPNYTGTLMSLANGIATISASVTPYVTGVLTTNQTITEWRVVFWIIFGIDIAAAVFYLIYGSGELQKWNDPSFLRRKNRATTSKSKNDGDDNREG